MVTTTSAHAVLPAADARVSISNIVKKADAEAFTLKEIRRAQLVSDDGIDDEIPPL